MPFIQVARSLDDLLYEVVTWLIFYPVTLWRCIRHPLRMMEYARGELSRIETAQFRQTLRPPIFLLLTVMLAYAVELAAVGENAVVTSRLGLANLINDDQSMMVCRIVAFALLPLVMAIVEMRLDRQTVDRDTLQQPFYAQCFLAAPFVLALCLAGTAVRRPEPWLEPAGLLGALAATGLYIGVEARWLKHSTTRPWRQALPATVAGYAVFMLILGSLAWVLGDG